MKSSVVRQTVVVTGGASGIGQSVVRQLVRNSGLDIIVLDRNASLGAALVSRLDTPRLTCATLDVMDSAGLTVIRDKMIEAGRQIQAVIHSVGSFASTKVLDASETEWRHSLEMNLDSVFRVSRIFLPTMLEQGVGNFVVVASAFGGRGPVSGFGVYGVAKAAVISLVRELAAEAAPFGVSVNSVSPGVLASPLLNAIPDYDKHADEIGRLFPLTNQVGDPAEIAKWVCSLATGELGWMTGQDVVVDGGFGCMPLFELAGIIP